MGRTLLSPREIENKDLHIGKILIFCEGSTEENYFDFFKKKIKDKFSNIVIETQRVGSNARAVLNYAEDFLSKDDNIYEYSTYEKYLAFDCDAPDDILKVIEDAKGSDNNYILLISSLLFECWLVMHLEEVEARPLRKPEISTILEKHLDLLDYEKHKDDEGVIAKIIKGDSNLKYAINNAKKLKRSYEQSGKDIEEIIKEKLPYSLMFDLVEQLAIAASK